MNYNFKGMDPDYIRTIIQELTNRQEEILEKAKNEKRDITDEETKEFDEIDKEIEKAELELKSQKLKKSKRLVPISFGKDEDDQKRLVNGINLQWRELFPDYRDTGQKPNDFLKEVIEKRTMLTGSGPSGGYTVPEQLWSDVYSFALMESIAMQRVRVFPMMTQSLTIPAWDSETRSDGTTDAGLQVDWVAEGGTFTKRTPKLRSMTLSAKKAGVYVDISRECLADSNSLDTTLTPLMGRAVQQALDIAIISGNGVGRPQGILHSDAAITVARTNANQVGYSDLCNMVARLLPGANPVWLVNPEAYTYLLQLADSAGSLIWAVNSTGSSAAAPANFLGFPVLRTDFIPGLGTEGDVILADLSFFALGMRQDIQIESTIAAAWTEDLVSFRCILRADGELLLDHAVEPMNGTDTLSPVVILS